MLLSDVISEIIAPAMELLPDTMDTPQARVMLLSIGQQESAFLYRSQMGGGPARGFWQFEQGTEASRGGVWGIYLHPASAPKLKDICGMLSVEFGPVAIYNTLATNDALACCVARLALFTDPKALPALTDTEGAWALYQRVWRPGKPRPETWAAYHQKSVEAIQ